eukprot:CAMPEP_0197647724 /NCGR_PEP_ID=MMETSP1338-20131121/26301_1 /TAXON_ID=43686 ORGANISM="Pelagodinium beii, Strain RCC1491" /NCGR_SAMPLE_ID=MMETSP1338 /ASSEMBLY_ACC=CAM_ASM_000754 /LENGTH=86 /DNA_ID=CAMNT_0043221585 /DNA_START=26 /DNA_END=284 /DNA_ORIENTATION=+
MTFLAEPAGAAAATGGAAPAAADGAAAADAAGAAEAAAAAAGASPAYLVFDAEAPQPMLPFLLPALDSAGPLSGSYNCTPPKLTLE